MTDGPLAFIPRAELPGGPHRIAARDVELWLAPTDVDDERLASLLMALDDGTLARASRFRQYQDRRQHMVAHAVLRTVLGAHLDVSPASIEIDVGANGKPRMAGPSPTPYFNISHTAGWTAVAISPSFELGVDVERYSTDPSLRQVAEEVFTEAERAMLGTRNWGGSFHTIWTRKEAVVKALGSGLQAPLASLDVSSGHVASLAPSVAGGPAWVLRDLGLPTGLAGAIAIRGRPDSLLGWRLTW